MGEKTLKRCEPKKRVGLIVVITGEGKGKTTSALGMAVRAAGHGMKVCVIHFMKGDMFSGEFDALERLSPDIEFHIMGKGFYGIKGDKLLPKQHQKAAKEALRVAEEKMLSGKFDMLILDEINNALSLGLIRLKEVLGLLDKKPPLMHIVLTGRDARPEVIEKAHTVTETKEIKHAFRTGIEPQKGVDY